MENIYSSLETGLQYQKEGRFQEARVLYRNILSVQPTNPDALHLLGLLEHKSGNNSAAETLIGQAISIGPNGAMYNSLGCVLIAQGKADEAISSFKKALIFLPHMALAHFNLGNAMKDQGDLDGAAECYRQTIHFQPNHAGAHHNLALVLFHCGDYAGAVESYCQTVALNPNSAFA